MHRLLWLVLLISSIAFAEDEEEVEPPRLLQTVETRVGTLEVRSTGGISPDLVAVLGGARVYKSGEPHLDVMEVFHTQQGEVVLFREDAGGSGTLPSYLFILLRKDQRPVVTPTFQSQKGPITTKQEGDTLTVDLGFDEGERVFLTYLNGKQSLRRQAPKPHEPADEEDCRYLYEQLYQEYVREADCTASFDNVSGRGSVRALNDLEHDPRLDLKTLRTLSKQSCKERKALPYEEFKKRICGAAGP